MPEPLELEGVQLATPQGGPLLDRLSWSLPAGGRMLLAPGPAAEALLRLGAGLLAPEAGIVRLGGLPLGPTTPEHPFRARGALGWVPTEGGLLVNLGLCANLALPLRFLRGLGRSEAEARAKEALVSAGLGALAGHRPHALAPLERWLGALLRAALLGPELWMVAAPPQPLEGELRLRARACLASSLAHPAVAALVVDGEGWVPEGPWRRLRIRDGCMEDAEA